VPDNPCRINKIPRMIPERAWYFSPPINVLLGGVLPFGSIFIEMYFIFTSFWHYKYYYVYGFLFLVYVILIVVTICVTIVSSYFLLNVEDYRWKWTSFLSAASTSVYVFLYATYYFFEKVGGVPLYPAWHCTSLSRVALCVRQFSHLLFSYTVSFDSSPPLLASTASPTLHIPMFGACYSAAPSCLLLRRGASHALLSHLRCSSTSRRRTCLDCYRPASTLATCLCSVWRWVSSAERSALLAPRCSSDESIVTSRSTERFSLPSIDKPHRRAPHRLAWLRGAPLFWVIRVRMRIRLHTHKGRQKKKKLPRRGPNQAARLTQTSSRRWAGGVP
jgi:Endomembrane protein 70